MGLKAAADVIRTGSVSAVVDYAIELHREIARQLEELKLLKVFLRERARKEAPIEADQWFLGGTLGDAQIVFPTQQPRAKKGVDLLAAEAGLPPEVFNALFVKKTVVEFAPDFTEKLAGLRAAHRVIIANLVEVAPTTPKVVLPK